MAYQRGCLKVVNRKEGETWVLRYRFSTSDGRRVEGTPLVVGLVQDFPTEAEAEKEVDRLGLRVRINCESAVPGRTKLDALAEFYLKTDFSEKAVRPKSDNTIPIVEHYVRDYIVARWGERIADDIKPLEIQEWLVSLRKTSIKNKGGKVIRNGLSWPTLSKIRGLMNRMYELGKLHEKVTKNPVQGVETRSKSGYKAIIVKPQQTLAILRSLTNALHFILVLTVAATALRASEVLSLRWEDIFWDERRIRVSKRWAKGGDGETKTVASDGYAALHSILAHHLKEWHNETPHAQPTDFVFPSFKGNGKIPLCASVFVADHLRPAAIAAGVKIADSQRFGLHNLRHSLATWLISKAKEDPKTVQGSLRHSKIQTTLDLYAQEDMDEMVAAQGKYLDAIGIGTGSIQ
jgi:integrase